MTYAHARVLFAVALAAALAPGCGGDREAELAPETTAGNVTGGEPGIVIEEAALQADREWRTSLAEGGAAATALLDDDFEWIDTRGQRRARDEAAGDLAALAGIFRDETDLRTYHYGHLAVITSARPGERWMRVWALRPDGWRAFAVIGTALATGTTPFAATGAAATGDCENPCRSMPYAAATDTEKAIAAIFMQLKMDEWRPNPERWAPYVLDDVYYTTAAAQLSKEARVEHLTRLKETGEPSVPGDPVVSMRIFDFEDSAVMVARHNPYRGGQPYLSVRVWAFREGRWQLANTQQTAIVDATAAPSRMQAEPL